MYAAIDLTTLEQKKCVGRGRCSFTGLPHVQLSGLAEGNFLTARKAVYPANLVKFLAKKFVKVYIDARTSRLWNVCKAVPSSVLECGVARREDEDSLDVGRRSEGQDDLRSQGKAAWRSHFSKFLDKSGEHGSPVRECLNPWPRPLKDYL